MQCRNNHSQGGLKIAARLRQSDIWIAGRDFPRRACHDHLRHWAPVPGQARDLARVLVGPHGSAELAARVLARNAAEHRQRDGHQRPDDQDDNDRAEGQRRSALQLECSSSTIVHGSNAIFQCYKPNIQPKCEHHNKAKDVCL